MSESMHPLPRIGDAERDRAVELLREHHAQGRLDVAEFEERVTAALSARVQPDLDRLFVDLPQLGPDSPGAPVPPPPPPPPQVMSRRTESTIDILVGLLWPAVIGLCFLLGWDNWWLLFGPIVVSSVWGQRKQVIKETRAQLEAERRPLDPGSQTG